MKFKPLLIVLVYLLANVAKASTYYVDSVNGIDTNSGVNISHPLKTCEAVNHLTLKAGDKVLFKCGSVWKNQTLVLSPQGNEQNPIIISSYGDGELPKFEGNAIETSTVVIKNPKFVEISNLEISNIDINHKKLLRGVTLSGIDAGVLNHITLKNLFVHDVTGLNENYHDEDVSRKSYGGIVLLIEGKSIRTSWDSLLIEGCKVVDTSAIGITFVTSWAKGHRTYDESAWAPSTNVIIRGNEVRRSARNGLIIRACVSPLIEHNLFYECAVQGSGNACFSFDCDDALFQYNESCFTKFNPGDVDAAGYDSDYNCRRSVFQYNYSHDNDYGFILICCNGKAFNDGTIVRYNISHNDNGVLVRFSGTVSNTYVYNNTLYAKSDMTNSRTPGDIPKIFYFKSWSGWAKNTYIFNNLIINDSKDAGYDNGSSTGTHFSHNYYAGYHPKSEPNDDVKLTGNISLSNVSVAKPGWSAPTLIFSLKLSESTSKGGLYPLKNDPKKDYLSQTPSNKSNDWFIGALIPTK
jgi:hypothetical protein